MGYLVVYLVAILISGAITGLVINYFFDDAKKSTKNIASFILFFVCLGIVRQSLDSFMQPSVDDILQQEALYVEVKKKYPTEYEQMVDKAQQMIKSRNLDSEQAIVLGQQFLQPLVLKRLERVDDKTRSAFVNATVKQMRILRTEGSGECFNLSMGMPSDDMDMALLRRSVEQSGINDVIVELFRTEKFEKAIVSEKRMQETLLNAQKYIASKYKDDVRLLANPNNVTSIKDKQITCDMMIDLFLYLNDPNDEEKMATLRKLITSTTM